MDGVGDRKDKFAERGVESHRTIQYTEKNGNSRSEASMSQIREKPKKGETTTTKKGGERGEIAHWGEKKRGGEPVFLPS